MPRDPKHTPGPWSTDTDRRFRSVSTEQLPEAIGVQGPSGSFVACAFDYNRTDRDAEVEWNAHLISAAPELLGALEAMRTRVHALLTDGTELSPMVRATFRTCVDLADAALIKARGF